MGSAVALPLTEPALAPTAVDTRAGVAALALC